MTDLRGDNLTSKDRLLDTPISSTTADLLGFGELATTLAEAIIAQPNSESITLGLDGPWGSGKSSIFRLLQESVGNIQSKASAAGIGLIVIPFSPWLITNRTALVAGFFGQLGNAIDEATERVSGIPHLKKRTLHKTLGSLRKKINSFSVLASIAATATSVIDPTMISAVTASGTKAISKLTKGSETTLEELKIELDTSLRAIIDSDSSFRILVLVDDLDRLDPSDASEILRLVKTVGDLPGITYLLAYDRTALARAISHSAQIENGDAYLEKIIQFSFKVPPLEPFQLRNWLRLEINDLFPGDLDNSSERARTVLDIWAGRLLHTPRDVKRLLFAIRAIWPKLRSKADLLDLIWLQMIKEKASQPKEDLYTWVTGYLQSLDAIAIGGQLTGEKEDREKLEQILISLGWKPYDKDSKTMTMDFHNLNTLLAGVNASYLGAASFGNDGQWTHKVGADELQNYRADRRLSSPWHWRLYFALDTPSHAVTDDEWKALAEAAGKSLESLTEAISLLLEIRGKTRKDVADQLMSHAIHDQKGGNLKNPDRWIVAITKQSESLRNSSRNLSFGLRRVFDANIDALARAVFKSIQGAERTSALEAIFGKSEHLCVAADLLRDQYHASSKSEYEKAEEYYLSDDELATTIKAQVQLYEALSPDQLRALHSPYSVLYAWRDVTSSDNGPTALLENALQDDKGVVTTLQALKHLSSSAQAGVPHVVEDYLEKFVDIKTLKSRVETIASSESEHASAASNLLKVWWSKNRH